MFNKAEHERELQQKMVYHYEQFTYYIEELKKLGYYVGGRKND